MRPLVELVPGVLAASKAPSSVKGYHSQLKKMEGMGCLFSWTRVFFPASAVYFSLYLICIVQSGYSFATINFAFYSVNVFHSSCEVPNPCNSSFVKAILEGYVPLFKGLLESMLVCPISERPVILGGVTLISSILIFLCIFLEVKPINMVPDQPG